MKRVGKELNCRCTQPIAGAVYMGVTMCRSCGRPIKK